MDFQSLDSDDEEGIPLHDEENGPQPSTSRQPPVRPRKILFRNLKYVTVPYEENEQRGFHSESSSTDEDDDDEPAPAPVQRGPKGGRIGPRLYVSCSIVILRWQVSMRQNILYRIAVRAEDKDFHPIHSNRKVGQFYLIDMWNRIQQQRLYHVKENYQEIRRANA